ncbi:unnamed protein product [Parnassius mnemosyne]|uniref:Uncharacterized protein n=1 Tax=Parnassius mnemosyne TaxID=213953 RepID=A0AAV1KZB2_9NEOP
MPLKRMPPKTPLANKNSSPMLEVPATPITEQSKSETNISNFDDSFVTTRRKNNNSELNHFMKEMKDMLSNDTSQNQQKISSLESRINEVVSQNSEIMDTLSCISSQYDNLNDKFQTLLAERKDRAYIRKLEDKISSLEQLLHASKVELKNIPKNNAETKEKLCCIVQKTAQTLDVHWVFYQDSAPAHRAKSTQDWLAAREIDFIRHEDWPSSSPDLNPLDYKIWQHLEKKAC